MKLKCLVYFARTETLKYISLYRLSKKRTMNSVISVHILKRHANGGCTIDPSFPWIKVLIEMGFKNKERTLIYRNLSLKYAKYENLSKGGDIIVECPWGHSWTSNKDFLGGSVRVGYVNVCMNIEAYDDCVIYDTNNSPHPCPRPHENLIILMPGNYKATIVDF